MFSRIRYFFEDIGYWLSDRLSFRRGAEAGERRRLLRLRRKEKRAEEQAQAATTPPPKQSAPAEPPPPPPPGDAPTTELPAAAAAEAPNRRRLPRPRLPRPSRPKVPSGPSLPRPGRKTLVALGVLLLAGIAVGAVYLATDFDFSSDEQDAPPAPKVVIEQGDAAPPEEAPELGFPAFATKNTTRVAGAGPVADAAGVALATSPATGGIEGPPAVSLVSEDDWPAAIAASALVAAPIGAPILLSNRDEVPELTVTALTSLAPQGSAETDDDQVFRFGDALAPEGLRVHDVDGGNPAELAAAAAAERERLTGKEPEHVVLVSSDRPEFSMPAAAWAARSGDPVLFVQADTVPAPTLEALGELKDARIYALGPEPVISDEVLDQVEEETKVEPTRIGEDDAVSNSIAFARFADGDFGWNVTDPGHGLVLANATRPADAGAAAPLSASGKWGPLLLTDNAQTLPAPLEGYLLDIKPGYLTDPTRAVYNHAWIIGDQEAISVDVQAQVDDLLEVAKVQSGRGQDLGALPGQGQPESQPPTDQPDDDQDQP